MQKQKQQCTPVSSLVSWLTTHRHTHPTRRDDAPLLLLPLLLAHVARPIKNGDMPEGVNLVSIMGWPWHAACITFLGACVFRDITPTPIHQDSKSHRLEQTASRWADASLDAVLLTEPNSMEPGDPHRCFQPVATPRQRRACGVCWSALVFVFVDIGPKRCRLSIPFDSKHNKPFLEMLQVPLLSSRQQAFLLSLRRYRRDKTLERAAAGGR